MNERALLLEDFQGLIGTAFTIVGDASDSPAFTLTEAKALSDHGANMPRPPFSLVFDMPGQQRFDQGAFALVHDFLGPVEIFLVPMARTENGIRYAATFY